MRKLQRRYAAWALDQLGGAKMETAERLQIDDKTLAKWLQAAAPREGRTATAATATAAKDAKDKAAATVEDASPSEATVVCDAAGKVAD